MTLISIVALVILVAGCSDKYKKAEQQMKQPINCATAEGDIRLLMHEKAHVNEQIAQGVSAFSAETKARKRGLLPASTTR